MHENSTWQQPVANDAFRGVHGQPIQARRHRNVFQEVVRRLHARFDHLLWMKLSEVARYWAAKELTRLERSGKTVSFRAPFACPDFTLRLRARAAVAPRLRAGSDLIALKEVSAPLKLTAGTWCTENENLTVCFPLAKGTSSLEIGA